MQNCKKKHAVLIGLDYVDENHYIKQRPYSYAETTAKNYCDLFENRLGFDEVKLMSTANETKPMSSDFENLLREWSQEFDEGDLLVISFTGHGEKVEHNAPYGTTMFEDEGWCFYDRVIFYQEIWALARLFRAGVQIVVMNDSCYAGILSPENRFAGFKTDVKQDEFITRNWGIYEPILRTCSRPREWQVPAAVCILSASSENGSARECSDVKSTIFGWAFMQAFEKKGQDQNLLELYEEIQRQLILSDQAREQLLLLEEIRKNVELPNDIKKRILMDQARICGMEIKDFQPRWHYYKGHKSTRLARKKPLLTN